MRDKWELNVKGEMREIYREWKRQLIERVEEGCWRLQRDLEMEFFGVMTNREFDVGCWSPQETPQEDDEHTHNVTWWNECVWSLNTQDVVSKKSKLTNLKINSQNEGYNGK